MRFPAAAIPCLLAALWGCGGGARPMRAHRSVVDMAGRTVGLPDSVRSVCSAGFSLNQILLMLGAAPRLCATTDALLASPWFVRLAPRVLDLPRPFDAAGNANAEALAEIRPDLVVVWNDDASAARMRASGLAVLVVRFSTPAEMDRGLSILSRALGGDAPRRTELFRAFRDSVDSLVRDGLRGLPESDRRGVYYAADDPQNTEGKRSLVTSWMESAGGFNVAARGGIGGVRAQVSREQILSWNPWAIVSRESGAEAFLIASPSWKGAQAVREGRVWTNPRGVAAWCTRSGEAAMQPLWAASRLHPRRFPAPRLGTLVARFFRTFYGYPVDSAEVAAILSGRAPEWGVR